MDAICKERLRKNVSWHRNFYYTFLVFKSILSEKKLTPNTKTIHQLSISDVKMLLLTGKFGKAHIFVCTINEIPAIYSNLENGAQLKLAHACYVFPL